MPIEFDQQGRGDNSGNSHPEPPDPAITFSHDLAPGAKPSNLGLVWIWLLLAFFPIVGFLIAIFQFQESKHAAARGHPWSPTRLSFMTLSLVVSFVVTFGVTILFIVIGISGA